MAFAAVDVVPLVLSLAFASVDEVSNTGKLCKKTLGVCGMCE